MLNEWKVYFGTCIGAKRGEKYERAGKEISINTKFEWDEKEVFVPSIYISAAGIVVDLCFRIAPEKLKVYYDLYEKTVSVNRDDNFLLKSPFVLDFTSSLFVGSCEYKYSYSYSDIWLPDSCFFDVCINSSVANALVEHYKLDSKYAWCIHRVSYLRSLK